MTRAEFHTLLTAASFLSLRFARRYVTSRLPVDAFMYCVELNQSCDVHATVEEVVFSSDDGRTVDGLSESETVSLLYRDGRCPEWIDVHPEAAGEGVTVFRLRCCGRYTDDPNKLDFTPRGLGPFGIKSPVLPIGFKDGDRFALPKA